MKCFGNNKDRKVVVFSQRAECDTEGIVKVLWDVQRVMDGEHEHPVIGTFDCYLKVQQFDAACPFIKDKQATDTVRVRPRLWHCDKRS